MHARQVGPAAAQKARAARRAEGGLRVRREKGNPNRVPKEKRRSREEDAAQSAEQREAAKVAAMEKRQQDQQKSPRIPLRGRRGHEIPAVG